MISRFKFWSSLCALCALCGETSAADWPQILGPNRDGTSAETGLTWDWGKDGPPVSWSKEVGAGWAGVATAGGTAFLFHRVGGEEVLAALDPATGAERWAARGPAKYRDDFGFDDGPRATPIVAGGRAFTLGANGDLRATDAAKGTPLWHRNVLADYGAGKGYFGVAGSPLVVGDKVLANVGGKGAGVVAFDAATGKELWKAADDVAGYSSPTLAEIGGKKLAVFFTRRGLLAVDPDTGAVAFNHFFRSRLDASVNAATPLVRDGAIFLTASYGTGAALLRPQGKEVEEVWANDRSLSSQYATPVRVGDYLYGADGRADLGVARLRCVAWATGEVKWTQERFGCAGLIAADGGVLAVTESGELVGFAADPAKYVERGRAKILDGKVRAIPSLSDSRLFARDEKRLVCMKLK